MLLYKMRLIVVGAAVSVGLVAASGGVVAAQIPGVPPPQPNGTNPLSALVGDLLGWLMWGALAGAVGGVLIGAISLSVGGVTGSYGAGANGRKWIVGGLGAALVAGAAYSLVETVFNATV